MEPDDHPDTEPPTLSIVLPTFNGARTIAQQISAILAQDAGVTWELVVVDNGSTDGTPDVVRAAAGDRAEVRIVSAPEQHNLSYVRNVGVAAARGDRLAFVDDDDLVARGWLAAIAEGLERAPLVASRLEYERLNAPDLVIGRGRFQATGIEEMFGLPIVSGAGHGCHRSVWDGVGGNDEGFGSTGEDFDFAMRVHGSIGVRPVFLEQAVYHYRLRSGSRSAFRQARRYGASHVQLYRRHARGSVDRYANLREAARSWWWITSRLPLAVVGIRRERWATEAGRRLGRLLGTVRYRTWLL